MGFSAYQEIIEFGPSVTLNGTTSAAYDLAGYTLVGIRTSSSMLSTQLTFTSAERSTGTYLPLRDVANNQIGVIIGTTATQFALDPLNFTGVRHVKIVSSATDNTTLGLVLRPV